MVGFGMYICIQSRRSEFPSIAVSFFLQESLRLNQSTTGSSQSMKVSVAKYDPAAVRCTRPRQDVTSVSQELLDRIPTGFGDQVFGLARQPGVQVRLPQKFDASTRECLSYCAPSK